MRNADLMSFFIYCLDVLVYIEHECTMQMYCFYYFVYCYIYSRKEIRNEESLKVS